MPELPDVEVFRRLAERHCLHRDVAQTGVPDPASLKGCSPVALHRRLHGRPLQACRRHGKFLFLEFADAVTLAMHFGTNGALRFVGRDQSEPSYTRVWLEFSDGGRLAYVNPRRIGHVQAIADVAGFIAEAGLGPDALDPGFSFAAFAAAFAGSRQSIKAVLMDQARMAGIGNIYSDEILFQARLHPTVSACSLDLPTQRRLFEAMQSVLHMAVHSGIGAEAFPDHLPRGFLLPERNTDGRCPRCGAHIRSFKRGGRTAYYCPRCQPVPSCD